MAEAEEPRDVPVVGEFHEDDGGEAFRRVGAGVAGVVAGEPLVEPVREGGQVRGVVDGGAERAEQDGGGLDGAEAHALHVAEHDAHGAGDPDGLVEVAADLCLGRAAATYSRWSSNRPRRWGRGRSTTRWTTSATAVRSRRSCSRRVRTLLAQAEAAVTITRTVSLARDSGRGPRPG